MTVSPPADLPGSTDRSLERTVHRRLASVAGADRAALAATADLYEKALSLVEEEAPLLAARRAAAVAERVVRAVSGFGALDPLLSDPGVTEVMLNGDGRVYVERGGRVAQAAVPVDATDVVRFVERVIAPLGLRWDRTAPILDARLPDGSRLHAVASPPAVDGPVVTVRRFGTDDLPLEAFTDDPAAAGLLRWAVAAGWNLLLSGGTSTGKTTALNALTSAVPAGERVVVIEETAELTARADHVVRLEARPPNAEGAGAVGIRDLVRAALRLRPDRIVVGEVRGAEALDMVQALNTGHDGSLCTIHAGGVEGVVPRLEALAASAGDLPVDAITRQISTALDAVAHLRRDRSGRRYLAEIAELVAGRDGVTTRTLWVDGRGLQEAPTRPPRRPVERFSAAPWRRVPHGSDPPEPTRERDREPVR